MSLYKSKRIDRLVDLLCAERQARESEAIEERDLDPGLLESVLRVSDDPELYRIQRAMNVLMGASEF